MDLGVAVPNIFSIKKDLSLCRLHKSVEELYESGFSASRMSDDACDTLSEGKIYILQGVCLVGRALVVYIIYVTKPYFSHLLFLRGSSRDSSRNFQSTGLRIEEVEPYVKSRLLHFVQKLCGLRHVKACAPQSLGIREYL